MCRYRPLVFFKIFDHFIVIAKLYSKQEIKLTQLVH